MRPGSDMAQGRPALGLSVSRSQTMRDPMGRSCLDRAVPVLVDPDRRESARREDTGRRVGPDSP